MGYLGGKTWQADGESRVGNLAGSESGERVMNAEESHRSPDHYSGAPYKSALVTFLRKPISLSAHRQNDERFAYIRPQRALHFGAPSSSGG